MIRGVPTNDLVDYAVMAAIIFGQWRIWKNAIVQARRRWPHRVWIVQTGMLIFAAGLLLSILYGNRQIVDYFPPLPQWLGLGRGACYLWAVTSSAAYFLYTGFQWISRRLSANRADELPDPSRRKLLQTVSTALVVSPFALSAYGTFIERTNFRVREIDIFIPGLHPDLEGLRLVQVSDIHLSPFLSEREFARVVDAANELRANLALVTGDLVSSRGDPLDACLRQVARLRAEAGAVGCLGNHEIYVAAEKYTAEQGARLGVPFLRSEARQYRFGAGLLNIAGVDYQRFQSKPSYLVGAERMIVPGAVNILLSHNPDVFPAAASKGFDLTVAGHTHGGQVTVEILDQSLNAARFFTRYVYGLYQEGRASAYVTRGIGTIGIPTRIGAPPEISLLRLKKA